MRRTLSLALLLAGTAPVAVHAQTATPPAPPPAPASKPTPAPAQTATPTPTPRPAPMPASPDDYGDEGDIIITGTRNLPGSVIGDIPPEETLSPADVRAYGVSSVSDLLTELAPQTGSIRGGGGGAPVVLLNGRRISSFAEIRDLPTEAISRVEILPEEVALKYGYRADQKVVNIVLRRRFRAFTVELGDRVATAGGRNTPSGTFDILTLARDNRFSLHIGYTASDALYESDRNIIALPSVFDARGTILASPLFPDGQVDPALSALSALAGRPVNSAGVPVSAAGGRPPLGDFVGTANTINGYDQGDFRTLLSSSRNFQANTVFARPIGKVNASINGSLTYTDSTSAQGLAPIALTLPAGNPFSPFSRPVLLDRAATAFDPLKQRNTSLALHFGGTANGDIGKWRWSLTANYDRVDSETFTETGFDVARAQARLNAGDPAFNPFGVIGRADLDVAPANRGNSTSNSGAIDALFNGKLFKLPAGEISASVRVGGSLSQLDSRSFRFGVTTRGSTERDIANGQLNVDVPIASKSKNVLAFLGDLSINGNIAVDRLSDFGTLTTWGYGANWSPIKQLRIIASVTDADSAPSASQLGDPVIATPNVRVFDYVTGNTVTVTRTSGGNPFLIAESKHTFRLGGTFKPWEKTDFTLIASYSTSSTRNDIAGFPAATAAVEAAFPTRFQRDGLGNLTAIDSRAVNFARSDSSALRWGFNFSYPLKSSLQKKIELWRAGKGPNPFAGLRLPNGQRVPDGAAPGAPGQPGGQPGGRPGAPGAATPPAEGTGTNGGRPNNGGGGFGGGGFGGGGGQRGGGGGFGGGGGGGGRAGQGGGRLQLAVFHTWHFVDRVDIAPGVPVVDLLNGGAIGSGGQSRHEVEVQAGLVNNGFGLRLSGNWQNGTKVIGGTPLAPTTLKFSSLGTLNFRLFADLSQQLQFIKKNPWAVGMRVTVGVDNIFDARQRVRDQNGATPISYQPDYLDPLGRTVRVSVRKLFF